MGELTMSDFTMRDFTYGVLCGGRSRRMGVPKETLLFGGRTYLELAIRRSAGADTLLSVSSVSDIKAADAVLVPDLRGGCGPLGGLESLLAACGTDWLIVSPVDTPRLHSDDLTALRSVASRGLDEAVVLRTSEAVHFTIAAYRADVAGPAVRSLLDSGCRRLDRLGDRLRIRFVDAAASERLINVNTPDDRVRADREGGRRPAGRRRFAG